MKRLLILVALFLAFAPATDCWAEGAAAPLVGTDNRGEAYHHPDDWPSGSRRVACILRLPG